MDTANICLMITLILNVFLAGASFWKYHRENRHAEAKVFYLENAFMFVCLSGLLSVCFLFLVK